MGEIGRASLAFRALLLFATLLEARAQDAAPGPTFSRDVAPLIFQHCTRCHRSGQVGPFPLESYGDVRKRARQIVDAIQTRQMPPWKPEPGYGSFVDENFVRAEDLSLLRRWVEQGAPEGDPKDLPPAPVFPDGWNFGEPDLVVTMPEAYTVAAEGRDFYRSFALPLNFPETRYVRAFQFRPSNPRVVHHALMFLDHTGEFRRQDEADPAPGFPSPPVGTRVFSGGVLGVWNPGARVLPFGDDMAKEIRRNTDLLVHAHYTSTGKVEQEQSSIGFWFLKEPPRRKVDAVFMHETALRIPAGEKAVRLVDRVIVPVDVDLVGVGPHAHYIAKECRAWATTPEGREIPLIWIKHWSFDWQGEYRFKEPVRIPKGSELRMMWMYDNSADNPRNPSRPPKDVFYGPSSEDEMARMLFRIAPEHPDDILKLHFALRLLKRE